MKPTIPLLVVFLTSSVLAQAPLKDPTPDEVKKMEAAVPEKARVAPEKPRKLLVFSVAYGFKHTSIPYGKKLVEAMAKKTGAFEAVFSDDLAVFEEESLKHFDAILFNNTNNEIFLPENFEKMKLSAEENARILDRDARLKKNLVNFIQSGKGLAVIHAGVASFRKWDEYGNIVGARFVSHPWGSMSTVTLKVDDPKHPVAAAAGGELLFETKDEIYQVTDPYSRKKLRVIFSLDTAKSDMTKKGIVRKDGDFALTWVKSYGQGRVFYCALGHDHHQFWTTRVVQIYLDGIQFALGDLKGSVEPSEK